MKLPAVSMAVPIAQYSVNIHCQVSPRESEFLLLHQHDELLVEWRANYIILLEFGQSPTQPSQLHAMLVLRLTVWSEDLHQL